MRRVCVVVWWGCSFFDLIRCIDPGVQTVMVYVEEGFGVSCLVFETCFTRRRNVLSKTNRFDTKEKSDDGRLS